MRIDASDDEKPVVKRGDWLVDERYGLVKVGGWSDAPLSWPYRKKTGTRSLILCGKLAKDVRTKSEIYIGVLIDCRVCSHGFLTNFILQNT